MQYVIAALLDFVMSLAAFGVWTYFDLDGWWQQKHIERGKKRDYGRRI